MSVETENTEVGQPAGDEMADLLAGYGAGAAENAPPAAASANDQSSDEQNTDEQTAAPDANVEQPSSGGDPQEPSLEDRLNELKEMVRANASQNDPTAVRKLYGEIGAMNRTLQDLKKQATPPAPAPVDDELTAALGEAERVAEDFPELGAPLVKTVKALTAKFNAVPQPTEAAPQVSQEQIAQMLQTELAEQRRKDGEEALKLEHPDFNTVINSKVFKDWINTKPAEQQDVIRNTMNPMVASRFLTDFKASQQVRQTKQSRLAAAVTPTGVAKPPAPSKLSAEEEIMLGYQRGAPRPLHKR